MKEEVRLSLRFLALVRPHRKAALAVLALGCLAAAASTAAPYFSRFIVDEGLLKRDGAAFLLNLGCAAGLFLARALLGSGQQFMGQRLRATLLFDLNSRVFRRIQYLPLSWHRDRSAGENAFKLDHDVPEAVDFVSQALPQAVAGMLQALLVAGILVHLDAKLFLVLLGLMACAYALPSFLVRKAAGLRGVLIQRSQEAFTFLDEHLGRPLIIKAFTRERSAVSGLARRLSAEARASLKHGRWSAAGSLASEVAGKTVVGLVALYGGWEVVRGRLTPGILAAVMAYLYQLVGLCGQILPLVESVAAGLVSCGRLAAILDEPLEGERAGARSVVRGRAITQGRVVFQGVGFGYRPGARILKGVSWEIEPGRHCGLVGPSGCGKTTLLSLLLRLYELEEGDILSDGVSIRGMEFASLRRQIGFAGQEPLLWNDTLANNIRYGLRGASEDEVLRAGRMALVDEFAAGLKDGMETALGENACRLSEGQRQKVAIARALVKRPRILVLDEALASIDPAGEERILANIKEGEAPPTMIVVSHRPSTALKADSVWRLG